MTKYKLALLSLALSFSYMNSAVAEYYNTITVGGYSIRLSKETIANIEVRNLSSGKISVCAITPWDKRISKGAGVVSLTSDGIGLLLFPGNKYLKVTDLLACDGSPLSLYSIPDPDGDINTVIDVNFKKKLFLSVYLMDVRRLSYQAKISYFGSNKNILSGRGFWGGFNKSTSDDDDFILGYMVYYGKISPDAKYVSPSDLDCSVDSFPGVWDIKRKKKVVLPAEKDEAVTASKCQSLFSGEKTLHELGGKLMTVN